MKLRYWLLFIKSGLFASALSFASAQPNTMECFSVDDAKSRFQVAGGEDANVEEYPFIVSLKIETPSGPAECGGSIVGAGWVLTAAHCVSDSNLHPDHPDFALSPTNITVIRPDPLGRPFGASRQVSDVFVHPEFDWSMLDSDVALLRLSTPFIQNEATPVAIADVILDQAFASGGECARVAGWGRTDTLNSYNQIISAGKVTDQLQDLNLSIVSVNSCRARYPDYITPQMLCAGDGIEGKNTCKGDSGGPLIVDFGALPVQVGVVSWAYGCAQQDHYSVFARVGASGIQNWIGSILSGGSGN
ncbi:MAG: serine protease [Pseudomonadota bacterium]